MNACKVRRVTPAACKRKIVSANGKIIFARLHAEIKFAGCNQREKKAASLLAALKGSESLRVQTQPKKTPRHQASFVDDGSSLDAARFVLPSILCSLLILLVNHVYIWPQVDKNELCMTCTN
jgi:hypothetical protein